MCESVNASHTVTQSTLGVVENSITNNIKLFPNPTTEIITITLDSDASYYLLSMLGQEVQKGVLVNGDNTLDISKLSKGLYLLNIKTNRGTINKKIIKQ